MNKIWISCMLLFFSIKCYSQHRYHTIDLQHPKVGQMQTMPVYFELDRFVIRPDAAKFLDSITDQLLQIDSFIFAIESHTDCRASKDYNRNLSQRRSDSIVAYMLRRSKYRLKLISKGIGEDSLLNDCTCEKKEVLPGSTRYFEDTIDNIITRPVIYTRDSLSHPWHTASRDEIKALKTEGSAWVPCSNAEQQRNRRTVLRIVGIRKDKKR